MRTSLFIALCCFLLAVYSQGTVPESTEIPNLPDLTQDAYHGWIQSDVETGSFLYYQFFTAFETQLKNCSSKPEIPVLLYLEGGPCDSSTLSLWSEFGPYGIDSNINFTSPNNPLNLEFTPVKRNLSWSQGYHILSIDSPVFTGYSFSTTGFMANSTETAGEQLIVFLKRFYQLYPQVADNPLYILGRSYGGHWAPYLAYSIMENHDSLLADGLEINLQGLILLSPAVDEQVQNPSADYFFAAGVTDSNGRDFIQNIDTSINQFFALNQTVNASIGIPQKQSYLLNMAIPGLLITTNVTLDNIRRNHPANNQNSADIIELMVAPQTFFNLSLPPVVTSRAMFNIPTNISFLEGYCGTPFILSGDFATSFSFAVEYLLEKGVGVTFLGGQDDGTVPLMTVVNLVNSLKWSEIDSFKNATRKIWKSEDGDVVGNYKQYKNLNMISLYKSGHLATLDQPEAVMQLLNLTTTKTWK